MDTPFSGDTIHSDDDKIRVAPEAIDNGPGEPVTFINPMDLLTITAPEVSVMFIPELGKSVRVKALNARERDAYEQSLIQGKGQNQSVNMRNARAKLAVLTLVDENGKRLYTDAQANEIGNAPAIVIERIFDRARRLAGITNDDLDELTGN